MNSHEALDYFHAAQEALAQGDLVNGLARLTKALALDETLAEARLLHGQLLLKMGYKEEAEADMQKLLELNPQWMAQVSGDYSAEGVEQKKKKNNSVLNPYGL